MKRVADRRVQVTRAKSDKRFLATDSTTTPEQQRKAALTACGWAASNGGVQVARELLEMLGLVTRPVIETRRAATGVGTTDLESGAQTKSGPGSVGGAVVPDLTPAKEGLE